MISKAIFGFGSLISEESLRATAPNATDFKPAYIKGFYRDFSLLDPLGYTETNLDLAGIPFPSLDVKPIEDREARVNGVVFTVSGKDLEKILVREAEYKMVETMAYDYFNDQPLGKCSVFSSGKNNATYDYDSTPLQRYLEVYLEAGKRFGDKYYRELLATTYINGRSLNKDSRLAKYL